MSNFTRPGLAALLLACAGHITPSDARSLNAALPSEGSITVSRNYNGPDSTANNTRTVVFTIHWTGNTNETEEVSYSVVCSGAATCTSQAGDLFMSKQLPIFDVTVTYSTASSGSGSVLLSAAAAGGSEAQSEILVQLPAPPPAGQVAVTPDNAPDTVTWNMTGASVPFTVSNIGQGSLSNIALTVSCTPSTLVQSCAAGTSSIPSLAAGANQVVHVTFNTSATTGTASIILTAATTNTDSGSYAVVVTSGAAGAPLVAVEPVQRLPRADCVTTSAGPMGAYQCGDLMLVHAMPAYKTLNVDRRLTLLYNSATASLQYYMPVRVAIPSETEVPDEVQLKLHIGNQAWTFRYLGSSFASGETRRVSLSFDASNLDYGTGLYAYKLVVSNHYGSTVFPADTTHGELVVVDRKRASDSPYGIGWSIAGVTRLYPGQAGRNALLIVDADASYITYDSVAPNTYRAARGAFRDTVVLGTFDPGDGISGTYYRQRDLDQTSSYYDTSGRLRWVVDKRGQRAEYRYQEPTNSFAVSAIVVAPAIRARTYTLTYTSAKLDSIIDPAARALNVSVDSNGFLRTLLDPGLTQPVQLNYSSRGLLTSWTSQLGHTFNYGYHENLGLLTSVWRSGWTMSFLPAQVAGIAFANAAFPVASAPDVAKTIVYGPRGIGDIVEFHVTRWGSPSKIINALGHTTIIDRTSPMNLLPTRIVFPDGAQKIITYSVRGSVTSVRDTANDAPTSVTEYVYGSGQNRTLPTLIRRIGDTYNDSTIFTVNILGLIATATEQSGLVTRFTYDVDSPIVGLLVAVAQDSVTTFLASSGNKARRRLVTRFTYNEDGNLISDKNPAGFIRTYLKDAIGRDTAFLNEVGNRRSFTYSPYNHLMTSTSHGMPSDSANVSLQTTYAYEQHTLGSVTDPRLVKVAEYLRDAFDRDTATIDDYNNKQVTYYDAAGNVDSIKPRAFPYVQRLRHDVLNRLEAKKWPARDSIPADSVIYQYDSMRRVTSAKSTNDEVTREYYGNGLLKKETQKHGLQTSTHAYVYDMFGRRTEYHMGLTEKDHIYYKYSPDGRRMSIGVQWRNTTAMDSVVILFDELGRRDEVLYYVNGAAEITRVVYGYDYAGVLRSVCSKHKDASEQYTDLLNVAWFAETVDSAGRATSIDANGTSWCTSSVELGYNRTNKFDGHGRLTSQKTLFRTEYRYDESGNMIAKHQFYNDSTTHVRLDYAVTPGHNTLDYYTSQFYSRGVRKMHITDDLNQSRTSETPDPVNADSAKLLGREYFYDGLGRKSGIRYVDKVTNAEVIPTGYREYFTTLSVFSNKLWAGDASALVYSTSPVWVGGQTSCKYDPLGRMLVPCDYSRALSFDGNNVVRTGDDRSNTQLGAYSFVHGPGVDDPLLGRKEAETVIYVTNGRSEILSYPNANGFESVHRLKDDNPMRVGGIFNAGSFDNQTAGALSAGLSYYRNRFYDAATGRWTQADPIGIAGGLNQYAYVGNNPATYTDPFGLCPDPKDPLCTAANVAAGFGDAVTLGLTRVVRKWMGTEGQVNRHSGAYTVGTALGVAASVATGAATAAAKSTVTVVHFTSAEGAAAIEASGALRAGSFVTLPSQVSRLSASGVEAALEIQSGRGAMSATFNVARSALRTPFNGPLTSGGAIQYQLGRAIPLGPGSFIPTVF